MVIKVCGMRDAQNIREVSQLGVDMIGMIFYPKSPRYVEMQSSHAGIIPDYAKRILELLILQRFFFKFFRICLYIFKNSCPSRRICR